METMVKKLNDEEIAEITATIESCTLDELKSLAFCLLYEKKVEENIQNLT